MSELKNLRTLIINRKIRKFDHGGFESVFRIFMGLRKLRVLKLNLKGNGFRTFSFPDSIDQLKHLRYFAFEVAPFTKLNLPAAFTKLYHMQVVDFGVCKKMAFSSGEDMMNLVNLRSVLSWADLDFPNIGRLICLNMLPFFTIRKEKGYESHQLKHLNKLQDKLQIHGLQNIKSKGEALEVNLAAKEKLTELVLVWDDESCSPEVEVEVLEGLCPSKYLERLEIRGYHGMKLPNWMMGEHKGRPKNVRKLYINGCSYH
jgi:hypothetical protein